MSSRCGSPNISPAFPRWAHAGRDRGAGGDGRQQVPTEGREAQGRPGWSNHDLVCRTWDFCGFIAFTHLWGVG